VSVILKGSTSLTISYHLFLFHASIQDYKIHMDMEIVIFA